MKSGLKVLPSAPPRPPLNPVVAQGWVRWVFWGLRVYIVGMLILVIIGFSRGLR